MSRAGMGKVAWLPRRVLLGWLAGAVLAGALAAGPALAAAPPRVLFVCQSGTVKSAIAREVLRAKARDGRIRLQVAARGLAIEDHVTAPLQSRLAAYHLDPRREPPRQLAQADLDRADIVILFDHLPPGLHRAGAQDWSDQPSFLNAFDSAMPQLQKRIDQLLATIAGRPAPHR